MKDTSKHAAISNFHLFTLPLGPILTSLLLLAPIPAGLQPEAWKLIALSAWMVLWWMTEAVPVAVTALLPITMMPLLGISTQKEVAANYADPLIFLFLGGFLIAASMQHWGLHRRIALHIVKLMGTSLEGIIGGFMVATAFLSMWISNTATTVMMFTVGISIIGFVSQHLDTPNQSRKFGLALMLGIAYSASIGGVGTLIGTPPNTLLVSFLANNHNIHVDFATWMLMGIPLVCVMLPITWLLLCKVIFSFKDVRLSGVEHLIDRELKQLGRLSSGEQVVLAIFISTALCWMARGWIVSVTGLTITDTSIALIAAILLFTIPVSISKGKFAVEWKASKQVPWGVLILFGGGLALAQAFQETKLVEVIGNGVGNLRDLDASLLILAVITIIIFLTEVTSNTATAATFLPVLGAVAVGLDLNPLLLTVPAALASSMAFMMPVATPPNAVVFSYEHMRIQDMMKAGLWLNLITIGLIYLAMQLLAPWVFGL